MSATPAEPAELDEPIEIVAYDLARARVFRGERDRLRVALATASLRYEHIGSTAVPVLGGRPVVDIMLGAPRESWAALPELRARVAALGYQDLGEAGVAARIYFRRRALRAINLALVELDGPLWRDNLALRDYLRAHPADAAEYAVAKRVAAQRAPKLLAYSDAKAPALAALLEKARAWRAAA